MGENEKRMRIINRETKYLIKTRIFQLLLLFFIVKVLRHTRNRKLDEQSSIDEFFHGKRLSAKQQGIILLGFSHSDLRPIVDILRLEGCHYFHEPLRYSPFGKNDIRDIQKYIVELISCRFKYIYRVFRFFDRFFTIFDRFFS